MSVALAGWVLGVSAAVGAAAGLLIGAVGVGGIILVPSLIQLPGITVQASIASCMFAYIFAGLVGGAVFLYRGSINWGSTAWLLLGAAPGSFAGAFVLQYVDDLIIKLVLYSVIFLSAVFSVYRIATEKKRAAPAEGSESRLVTAGSARNSAVTDRSGRDGEPPGQALSSEHADEHRACLARWGGRTAR